MHRSKIPQNLDASGISLKFTEISLEKGKYNVADNVVASLELSYHDIFFYILFNFMYLSLLAHLSRRLTGELIVYTGIRRPSVRRPSTFSNDISSEAVRRILSIFHIQHICRGNKKLCFLFRSDKNSGCYGNL